MLRVMCLIIPMLLFGCLRLPALIHQPGMQDEQWFSVPGLTVWNEGIPRIPYLPTRNRETLFENADVCLMALPPGLFYVQAPFFGLLRAGYPAARVPLFLAALATIAITFWVVKRLGGNDFTAGAAAMIVAFSRPLLFTGLTARPDLLSALAGWISIIIAWEMLRGGRSVSLAFASGAACGLAGLFHPFALVFAIQGGTAMLLGEVAFAAKVKRLGALIAGAMLVIASWIPLIVSYPDEFRSQFFANVLDRAGPGLPLRLLWPFPSLAHHARLLYEFAGPLQCLLLAVALVPGSFLFWRYGRLSIRQRTGFLLLVWSSVYLTATVAGLHPTKGYWVYPFVWAIAMAAVGVQGWVAGGVEAVDADSRLDAAPPKTVPRMAAAVFVIAMLMLIPGSGLRTSWIYLSNWKDPSVYAPGFIDGVLEELPSEGVFYADLSYVFDVYLSGRETRLCQERLQYWGDGPLDYSYLILSWEGEDANWANQYEGRHVGRIGDRVSPQNCFVDLYRPRAPKRADPTIAPSPALENQP
jgi:hypothetical protein